MRSRRTIIGMFGALLGATTLGALGLASQRGQTGCPGKIICPLTGELICRDECPAIEPQRDDCPGRVECPLDGELVCRDRCPLGEEVTTIKATERSCCRGEDED